MPINIKKAIASIFKDIQGFSLYDFVLETVQLYKEAIDKKKSEAEISTAINLTINSIE